MADTAAHDTAPRAAGLAGRSGRARAAAAVVALALVAACSGGSDGDEAAPATTTDDPSSSPTTADAAPAGAGVCWSAPPADGSGIAFDDATEESGLVEPLTGMRGHAAAAADVDGDGWTDLFVGGFADRPVDEYRERGADGPAPDRLLRGGPDGYTVDPSFPGETARTSGAVFADLDDDGDPDLVVTRNPRPDDELSARPTTVYRNDGDAWVAATTLLPDTAARSVAALDVDRVGLVDLAVARDRFGVGPRRLLRKTCDLGFEEATEAGGLPDDGLGLARGPGDRDGLVDLAVAGDRFGDGPTRLLRNTGDLGFEDASEAWGLPDDVFGLALAPVDLDGDGWLDIVVSGDPRVLRGGPDGFTVVEQPVLAWDVHGDEDDPAGIAVGDLDGDGRPDLAIGQHFNSTVDEGEQVPVRLFLNRSETEGGIDLEDVTDEAGSPALWTKSPHVAIVDLDADGRNDVVTSAVSADGTPLVLHGTGVTDGVPRFDVVGEPGDGPYWITGVADDLDHDGRVDVFMVEWEPSLPSILFRNTGAGGPWVGLDVSALGAGVAGARVEVTGTAGDALGTTFAASTTGYAAGAPPVVHVGLGDAVADGDTVTVVATPVDGDPRTAEVPVGARGSLGAC
jgi:hypothetical protein